MLDIDVIVVLWTLDNCLNKHSGSRFQEKN